MPTAKGSQLQRTLHKNLVHIVMLGGHCLIIAKIAKP
jgi:hypothetical protein